MLKIGNAQGFWGDRSGAPGELVSQQPDLNYLTLDYLAEVSMSLLALQKEKVPSLGYASDFLDAIRSLIPHWESGSRVKVVANAGGLNPWGCAQAVAEILRRSHCLSKRIGVVTGDDVLDHLKRGGDYPNLDTGESIGSVRERLVSANAYLGAGPIAEALQEGADIVITGRVADPSLTVGCCLAHFGWTVEDYDKIAQATVAGHLIECGTQATGGISTNWLSILHPEKIGFPVVEMSQDGTFVLTKPSQTGGVVNQEIVKEQLLYELGDPGRYLSPDATVSFLSLQLKEGGVDRILVSGAKGLPPPPSYKVSATFRDGYMAEGMLTLFGPDAYQKAHRCGEIVIERVRKAGYELERARVEFIGGGDLVSGLLSNTLKEVCQEGVLRITVKDPRKEAVDCFGKELAPLVTSGPQGTTGYFSGRPKTRRVFGFWPCLIPVQQVPYQVKWMDVS